MKKISLRWSVCWILLLFLSVPVSAADYLIPVGRVIGLELSQGSVSVAAFDDGISIARNAGLQIGDRIRCLDGKEISTAADVRQALTASHGSVELTVVRNGEERSIHMEPEITADGPKLGIYLRQGITGIGTVTWYDPDTDAFGTLGHGVNDKKGKLLPMEEGHAYPASVVSIQKGKSGHPGQLKGCLDTRQLLGTLKENTDCGVFGTAPDAWQGSPVEVGSYETLHPGAALIRCAVSSTEPQDYSVEILKIYPQGRTGSRNLLLKITDPALLAATGGIVQGMSGSPILQDGRLIGAVTHVLVNDPTMGYGIFIGNMLAAGGR